MARQSWQCAYRVPARIENKQTWQLVSHRLFEHLTHDLPPVHAAARILVRPCPAYEIRRSGHVICDARAFLDVVDGVIRWPRVHHTAHREIFQTHVTGDLRVDHADTFVRLSVTAVELRDDEYRPAREGTLGAICRCDGAAVRFGVPKYRERFR